jgi:hypothetical protein
VHLTFAAADGYHLAQMALVSIIKTESLRSWLNKVKESEKKLSIECVASKLTREPPWMIPSV